MAQQDDGLFLLEILIEKIVFTKSPSDSDKDFRTCVRIQCPSVEPLEICDDDPGSCVSKSGSGLVKAFNNGKSCLFSLTKNGIGTAMSSFPVQVTVYKSMACGCIPTTIVIGEASIDMTKEFIQARNTFLQNPQNVTYQALKDSFRLVAPDGNHAGDILMFLRISCFGKLIITRFQGGAGPPNLGGGVSNAGMGKDLCVCGGVRGPGGGGLMHGVDGVCPRAVDPYDSMPCHDPEDPCFCTGPQPPPKQKMVCRNTDQYCLHVPKDCCPPGNKVVFKIPEDTCGMNHKQRTHFYFKDGIGDVSRDDPTQLCSTSAPDYPGVVYDYKGQVIKLRIGKTMEMPGRKSKLEYQFITPVIKQEKVVAVNEPRTAQCKPPACQCYPNCCKK